MRKRDKVLTPATSGQVGEIAGALIGEMNFSKDEANTIIGNMGEFRAKARDFYSQYHMATPMAIGSRISSGLVSWGVTYEKLFGKKPDFSGIRIPEVPESMGPVRLIVVASELNEWAESSPLQYTQDALKKHFPCNQSVRLLDESITTNDRAPKNGSYAVWVKDVREADEENANKSINKLRAKGHAGITTLERQLLEADYFFEKGEHLDQENVTFCTGSRYGNGGVPRAHWRNKFDIDRYDPAVSFPALRSRRVWA